MLEVLASTKPVMERNPEYWAAKIDLFHDIKMEYRAAQIIERLVQTERVIVCLFCFFFFKQKTAYEISECDWSSDVCSSDLSLISCSSCTSLWQGISKG